MGEIEIMNGDLRKLLAEKLTPEAAERLMLLSMTLVPQSAVDNSAIVGTAVWDTGSSVSQLEEARREVERGNQAIDDVRKLLEEKCGESFATDTKGDGIRLRVQKALELQQAAQKGWKFPKRGDRLRLTKDSSNGSGLKKGEIITFDSPSTWSSPMANKSWEETIEFAVLAKINETQTHWVIPISELEPV